MQVPKISVLMAVYNAETYLAQAIESILHQTFSDFEFLIIDDGSIDETAKILQRYSKRDGRIVLVQNPQNLGLSTSLNKGLEIARGQYIARMDGDDISLSNRFQYQFEFMEKNPQIGICGTWTKIFGVRNHYSSPPQHDAEIKSQLFFASAFAHPTVIMRKSMLDQYNLWYDATDHVAGDYIFWTEAARFMALANLPQILLHYRTHAVQDSTIKRPQQVERSNQVRLKQLQNIIHPTSEEQQALHLKIAQMIPDSSEEFLYAADRWLQQIITANQLNHTYPEPTFSRRIATQWFYLCRTLVHRSLPTWTIFKNSPLSQLAPISLLSSLKFRLMDANAMLRS